MGNESPNLANSVTYGVKSLESVMLMDLLLSENKDPACLDQVFSFIKNNITCNDL